MIWLVAAALAQDRVAVRGSVRHAGSGPVLVEVLLVDTDPPLLVASTVVLEGNGRFELPVEPRLGTVRVRAAADLNRDGIGEDDPQALWPEPLTIGVSDIDGIELHLEQPGRPAPGSPGNP